MTSSERFRADMCWRDRAGEAWVEMQERMDAQLDPFGRAVLERLSLRAGEQVLDIGCGTGQTLIEIAEAVGPTGGVLGIDVAEPMALHARKRIAESGYGHVHIELADAQTYSFKRTFDCAFSRFGVMFFPDPIIAFRNLLGALRPGGRLGFVCWQAMKKNDWATLLVQAVRPILGPDLPPLLSPGQPGPFYFGDAELVRRVLGDAGFEKIAIEPQERELHLGGAHTLDVAVDFTTKVGPAARLLAEADPDQRSRTKDALEAALAPHVSERGVWLGAAVFLVTAEGPRA